MSYDDWLTTPPPMESAGDDEDDDVCHHGKGFDEPCIWCEMEDEEEGAQ